MGHEHGAEELLKTPPASKRPRIAVDGVSRANHERNAMSARR
jgi:hypothetical protein